jgi:hypothetical protein
MITSTSGDAISDFLIVLTTLFILYKKREAASEEKGSLCDLGIFC